MLRSKGVVTAMVGSHLLRFTVHQGFSDFRRKRFLVSGTMGRQYVVVYNKTLEFRIYSESQLQVQLEAVAHRNGLLFGRPKKFAVFFEGMQRGYLYRSCLYPLRRDILILDGHRYPVPDRVRRRAAGLGVRLSHPLFSSMPSVSITREQDVLPGLLILAWVTVRAIYIEG